MLVSVFPLTQPQLLAGGMGPIIANNPLKQVLLLTFIIRVFSALKHEAYYNFPNLRFH